MRRYTRLFFSSTAMLSLAAVMFVGSSGPLPARSAAANDEKTAPKLRANPPVSFAHTRSDLAPDPAAHFGKLPNGMTYVIYKNQTPPGTASVWMRVGAGSVMEQDDQRGLAHFLEHLAFNGSKNVPNGEMVNLLKRNGLQFGADINAQTSFFETVYTLDLPNSADKVVDDALFLMRETAGNLTLAPKEIELERGVVLGEERARASAAMRASEAEMAALLAGTKYPNRSPIGMVDVLKTAQRPAFARFYNDFYRPEYTTLIVVGDIDPSRIETEIRRRFSDWRPGPQSAGALTDFGTLLPRTAPQAKVYTADGLPSRISISWTEPPVDTVQTMAKDLEEALVAVAYGTLNERFSRAAKQPDSAFLGASLERMNIMSTARVHSLNIRPKDGQDQAAFKQVMAIFREFLANGPTQAEIDRAMVTTERFYQARLASARTIQSPEIIGRILQTLGSNSVLQSPAQAVEEFAALKPSVTLAAVNAAIKRSPFDKPPLLWRQGEQAALFDENAMLAAYRAAMTAPIVSFAERKIDSWPYTDFGPPSPVVSRETLPGVNATRVKFANGVILTVKQTDFEDNSVQVSVQIGNGNLGVRTDQAASAFVAKNVGLAGGGLGKLSSEDIQDVLAGRIYGLGFALEDNATNLNGATTRDDFNLQMQVLAAFVTDPGFRSDALNQFKAALPSMYNSGRTSPDGVYGLKARGDLFGGDPRFSTPAQSDALKIDNDHVAALLKDQLAHGPIDITVVGDITPDQAIAQVGATFGALPKLPPATAVPNADLLRFPTKDLHRVYTHDGRDDQNLSIIAWPTTDFYADPRRAAGLELLAAVMSARALEEVREKQSASYSATVASAPSRYYPGFGYLLSRSAVRPEADEAYYRTISAIADDLKRKPVTPDELMRARSPLIARLHSEQRSNAYWLWLLSGTVRDPRKILTSEVRERDLLSITAADIQALARTYLDMTKALRIQIKHKDEAAK